MQLTLTTILRVIRDSARLSKDGLIMRWWLWALSPRELTKNTRVSSRSMSLSFFVPESTAFLVSMLSKTFASSYRAKIFFNLQYNERKYNMLLIRCANTSDYPDNNSFCWRRLGSAVVKCLLHVCRVAGLNPGKV